MNFLEKKLYHQIHPIKLLTDWVTGFIALYFLWYHHWLIAVLIMFIPALIVSIVLVIYVDLGKIKTSRFGQYVKKTMTTNMEVVRFAGYAIAVCGAWFHMVALIVIGLIIILFGWLSGMFFK